MNDIVESARAARQKLAAALALLQTPEAGEFLDTVAEPVARAMGALHGIESSGGASLAIGGPTALGAVREALGALQSAPPNGTLERASEQVAGSLGLVHGLAQRAVEPLPAAQPAQKSPSQAPPSQAPPGLAPVHAAPRPLSSRPPPAFASTALSPSVHPQPEPNFAKTSPSVAPPEVPPFAKTSPSVAPDDGHAPAPAPPGAGAFDKTAMASRSPVAHLDHTQKHVDPATVQQVAQQAVQQVAQQAVQPPAQQAPEPPHDSPHQAVTTQASRPPVSRPLDSKHAPAPSEGPGEGALVVEANLGAHSATNFYKGLSGNDIVADGGLFIATYKIPPIGTPVWLKVTMPGGYDFEAGGQVRWSRESGAGDAPPGFGASLQALSKEAKQLIYRYVKNREPLFHDDL